MLHFPEERSASRPMSLEKPLGEKTAAIRTPERRTEERNPEKKEGGREGRVKEGVKKWPIPKQDDHELEDRMGAVVDYEKRL